MLEFESLSSAELNETIAGAKAELKRRSMAQETIQEISRLTAEFVSDGHDHALLVAAVQESATAIPLDPGVDAPSIS